MSPPVSGTLYREVVTDDYVLDGEHVPRGLDVGVSVYSIHHNEDIFPDSYRFKPERWIVSENNPKEAVDMARHVFSVYSIGTRACAGRNMAYMELSDILARTLWYLDFRRAEGPLGELGGGRADASDGKNRIKEFQLEEHLTCHHDGPLLQFRVRDETRGELFSVI